MGCNCGGARRNRVVRNVNKQVKPPTQSNNFQLPLQKEIPKVEPLKVEQPKNEPLKVEESKVETPAQRRLEEIKKWRESRRRIKRIQEARKQQRPKIIF